jgi:AcrR family transcriptional regulator
VSRLKSVGKVGKRAQGRRDEIVRGAAAVLRQGRDGTLRMAQVAKHVGLVKGNLYYYFKDRQELIFHCHVRCTEMSLAALEEIAPRRASAEERLREFLRRHIDIIIASEYGGALLADIGELTAAQRRRYVALRDRVEGGVRGLIKEGIARKEFRPLPVPLAGFAILGSINWMPKWHRTDGALPTREVADSFVEFFIRGLKA